MWCGKRPSDTALGFLIMLTVQRQLLHLVLSSCWHLSGGLVTFVCVCVCVCRWPHLRYKAASAVQCGVWLQEVATNQPALPDAVEVKLQICSPAQTACHHGATDDSNKLLTGTAAASASLWQHYAPFIAHLHLSHLTMWIVII